MARVEIASQSWGWLTDSAGNGQSGATATLKNLDGTNATTYSAVTGGTSSTATLTSAGDGTLPSFVEEGTYTLTVGSTTRRVEALAGDTLTRVADLFNVKAGPYNAAGDGATDDTDAIEDAIAALVANGGGTLYFPPGRYITRGGHSITVPCVIRGAGYGTIASGTNGASILSLKNAADTTLLTIAAKAVTNEDLGLVGNKANQTSTSHGIAATSAVDANYFRFSRLWIDGFRDNGIDLASGGTSLEGMAVHVEVRNCGAYGLNVQSTASDCQFTDCIFASCTTAGAQVAAGGTMFSGCHFWGNTGDGVVMPSGAGGKLRMIGCYVETNGDNGIQPRGVGNQIVGCHIWKNAGRGIYAFSNTGLLVSGCHIEDNNTVGASGATGAGINLDTCTACTVTGNVMANRGVGGAQKYGYAESTTTCNGCVFIGNVSRAADHGTGNWLIGASATPTIPSSPASYNVG